MITMEATEIADRAYREVCRLSEAEDMSITRYRKQKHLAEKAVYAWGAGDGAPSAISLYKLDKLGADILWILTRKPGKTRRKPESVEGLDRKAVSQEIGRRAYEEISRLTASRRTLMSVSRFAHLHGISDKNVYSWKNCGYAPGSENLWHLWRAGADVLWIVTGRRA